MASPENNVINLRPEAPMVEPERPCWAVYEHWVINEKGRKLRPGVYWHSFKRAAAAFAAARPGLPSVSRSSSPAITIGWPG